MPVVLRPLSLADTNRVHELISNIDVVRHMLIPLATDRSQSVAFVEASMDDTDAYITRAIALRSDPTLIGVCGIAVHRDYEAGEIWYLLDPAHWGKGLMTEAVQELLAIAFVELNLHRVWATCCPENSASSRVLEKAGLRREGYHVRNLMIQGEWRDSYLYAMLQDEWRPCLGARARTA